MVVLDAKYPVYVSSGLTLRLSCRFSYFLGLYRRIIIADVDYMASDSLSLSLSIKSICGRKINSNLVVI